ncbi:MAG: PSD1 domain-containing protein [Verrucomicrobiales bacterium]|nr:PSD1 domain-containing protein [Verrucomicrobiales bacterium]
MKRLTVLLICLAALPAAAAPTPVDFNRDIRPILSDKCFFCHGPDAAERKADLRLDTAEGATADLGGYAAIVPGQPEKSEFVARITATDADEIMPPPDSHKTLKPAEIALLTRWIQEGAAYSAPWAYVAPRKHPEPAVKDAAWPTNWVDRFILSRLEAAGLTPSPQADRVTLIRRLHFDLTGLPPSPRAVADFVAVPEDRVEAAWAALVDDLLKSPRHGERLAVYWLDLVRYADTVGYHGDQDHHISPYRDWVVDALNANLPFDQFTREQLAGDLLPGATLDQKVATGYNRLLQTSHEGGVQEKEYLAIYAADRVRNVSSVWMGSTLGCAQCHDHKYDPYTARDFYTMAAFFADVDEAAHLNGEQRRGLNFNSLPSPRPPEIAVPDHADRPRLAELEATLARQTAAGQPTTETQAAIDAIRKRARLSMVTAALPEPRMTRLLPRGNWLDDSGEVVQPAIPAFLGKLETGDRRANRLDLANWFTDAENGAGGLTARVFANRYWYLLFGEGLSRSLDDFGGQGEPPSHPELLDNLAVAYVESGWDTRALIRLLVTSRAYRQSSVVSPALREQDPENRLVARQARHRLPAEMIRDTALAVSGLLVLDEGGRSARPYQPEGYYKHLNFPTRTYVADQDTSQWRRGLYVHWQRQFLHPMMKAMDAPSREECTAQRPRSNTPSAALVLLNDPTFIEAARVFAARVLAEGGTGVAEQIDFACRETLSRPADADERQLLENLLAVTRAEYESDPAAARALLGVGLKPAPDGIDVVELASWTAVTRALLNLSETFTRN